MADEIIGFDYDTLSQDGSDNLTTTIMNLLNSCPMLSEVSADYIDFQVLDTLKGIAIFPSQSIAILTKSESITGHVKQLCSYSFLVVYRTRANSNKEKIKEWLDNLGRWLEKQKVGNNQLSAYPELADGMSFKSIERTSQSYQYGTTEDKAEDWAISIQAQYYKEYDK